MRSARVALILAMALVAGVGVSADTPAVFQSGTIPTLSIMSVEVGGGEVLLEVSVDKTGAVTAIKPLRETATFTERMTQAVKTWRFKPAEADVPASRRRPGGPVTEPVDTRILVAGVFRRPAVIGITLGEPIKDVAPASTDIPYPTSVVTPPYPPGTMAPGVVLVEVKVDASGNVTDAATRIPSPGFDSAALSTARQWKFRPAKPGGAAAASVAYIVFGFPTPKG
ncbi:MAG TPA: TonB family protein [Vicinamibacterales bacterium]|nr:TonB family protein [Vicinamibacterales bacterium]